MGESMEASTLTRIKRTTAAISLLTIVLVLTACGQAATPVPTSTMTPTAPPTLTATTLPPTDTPVPTPLPPASATPEPTRAASAASDLQTVWLYNPAGVRADGMLVDWQLGRTMEDAGITKPPLAGQCTASRVEMILAEDPFAAANKLFYQRGWTDGLPIVPPTDGRLAAMLRGTDLPPNQVVATLDPMGGQATVEKIAVNAVMAGCRPEYMPVLIAAVEAIADPVFNLVGVGTTTNPNVTMLIINGPIAKQLDINSGANALGRGWQANATIGRALHLIEQNIGGSWPGVSDASSLGQPGDYSMMLAENEAANPWQPLHVERGFTEDQNVVTVVSAEGMQRVLDIGVNGEGFLGRVADFVAGRDTTGKEMMLVVTPFTANKLVTEGWNKESIRQFINDNTRIPFSRYKTKFIDTGRIKDVPPAVLATTDPNAMIQVPFIEQLAILVAGGVGEKDELIPLWSPPVSREIRLPPNWDELLKQAEEELGPLPAD
jgi:hypothetical protein